ncbi:methyltransferase domain-containing protein [Parapusillimonas sp. JC17]|uniref:methyltransferase domain-containing protein n=1 Tax=Parapusillimonas sp. JC17 TaxID=3445768 RepID=UPI003F9F7BB0
MKCRHCGQTLHLSLIDLGSAPPSNAYLSASTLQEPEVWYPLRVLVCEHCWLVQTEDYAGREALFTDDYAYFSSYSDSWLAHARQYVNSIIPRFGLTKNSHVVEIAANDGYLLQYIKQAGIPCTGIEPTASTAAAAREKGLNIIEEFFGVALAEALVQEDKRADLLIANNVLAHVPDINDFTRGFATLLNPDGVATFEFPHLLRLVMENQFDTIYHEHYSYLSLTSAETIFAHNGLALFDVEELPTHGGSLRLYAQRSDTGTHTVSARLDKMRQREQTAGITTTTFYSDFQIEAEKIKNDLLGFLLDAKQQGKQVGAYGAAAKGNTLLNFAGVRPDLLPYVVDRNPAKQDKFLPGSRIPIVNEAYLIRHQPNYVLILPWNLHEEICAQLQPLMHSNVNFVVTVPTLTVL